MKKIIVLIFLMFIFISCSKEKIIDNKNVLISDSETKLENKIKNTDINKISVDKNLTRAENKLVSDNNTKVEEQIIIKDYGNGLILKQETKGNMNDQLGFTTLYLNEKELISLPNKRDDYTYDLNDSMLKKTFIRKFLILEAGKKGGKRFDMSNVQIDDNSNIIVLYLLNYDDASIYFIDLKNKKLIKSDYYFARVKIIKQGKSGTFIMLNGIGGGLSFIDNNSKEIKLFLNNFDYNNNENYKEIIDFELMLNKQIKIFYKGQNSEKREAIIQL